MEPLSTAELKSLMLERAPRCVSIYLASQRAGTGMAHDQLQLRALLRQAEGTLKAEGRPGAEIAALLQPAHRLLTDSYFWRHVSDGLALFLAPHRHWVWRLPRAFDDQCTVAHRFQVKPLLALLSQELTFYLLALSQKSVRLFRGTRHALSELEALPFSLKDTHRFDTWQKEVRTRSGAPVGAGRWSAIFYGSGGGAEIYKDEVQQFCHHIEHAVTERLSAEHAPLVLAGVDYLVAMYRSLNRYPHLIEGEITGNPDRLSSESLQAHAWPIVQPLLQHRQTQALAEYCQRASTRRATHDLRKVVRAAHRGQVQTLFVADGREQWGVFDPETQAIHLFEAATPDADDLLNLAAIETLAAQGTVFLLPTAAMPDKADLAAILRY
jgi:hypothetical protein